MGRKPLCPRSHRQAGSLHAGLAAGNIRPTSWCRAKGQDKTQHPASASWLKGLCHQGGCRLVWELERTSNPGVCSTCDNLLTTAKNTYKGIFDKQFELLETAALVCLTHTSNESKSAESPISF